MALTGDPFTPPSLLPLTLQVRERLALTGDPFTPPSPLPLTLQVRERLALTGDPGPLAYARTPLVDLPLGATEDRVCGTIDFERALMEGGLAGGDWWSAVCTTIEEMAGWRAGKGGVRAEWQLAVCSCIAEEMAGWMGKEVC